MTTLQSISASWRLPTNTRWPNWYSSSGSADATPRPAGRPGSGVRCNASPLGYGYRPWLAVCWLIGLWMLGSARFLIHQPVPIDADQYPACNPWLFAADTLLPIVNLGQDGYWRLTGASQWIAGALVAAGRILATTAAAGAARTLQRVCSGADSTRTSVFGRRGSNGGSETVSPSECPPLRCRSALNGPGFMGRWQEQPAVHSEATEVRVSNWVRGHGERRAASGRHVLDEEAVLTPIFHALNHSGWRARQQPERMPRADEVDEFRRDPLTAPIPIRAFEAARPSGTRTSESRTSDSGASDSGAHALVEPREGGRHHFRLEAAGARR